MKQLTLATLAALLCASLTACGNSQMSAPSAERFLTIRNGVSYSVVVDRETGVEYLLMNGGITFLVDAEGNPMIYEGEL